MPSRLSQTCALFALLFLPSSLVSAQQTQSAAGIQPVQDRAAFLKALKLRRSAVQTGLPRDLTERDDPRHRSFPHFSSSFSSKGQSYPYTMVGHAPESGQTAHLRAVIIPLQVRFLYFAADPVVFSPAKAVENIMTSPIFQDARFPNGVGQFGDMMQRATFWNKMDRGHEWHVRMEAPRVLAPIDVQVTPDIGSLTQLGKTPDTIVGNVSESVMDSSIHTILQLIDIAPDEVAMFVTYNVSADALGYHSAFARPFDSRSDVLQTMLYTSWFEPALVGDLLADISTFNHEFAEWLNDPYVNNMVPAWEYPPKNMVCADNPYLEVGDPQGNGPDYNLFPTVPVPLHGYTYHLQDLVMLPWFTGEVPSTAQHGWYDFPDTTQITAPSVPCP